MSDLCVECHKAPQDPDSVYCLPCGRRALAVRNAAPEMYRALRRIAYEPFGHSLTTSLRSPAPPSRRRTVSRRTPGAEAFAEDEPAKLRAELLQVAAVAVAWVEKIDRKASAP